MTDKEKEQLELKKNSDMKEKKRFARWLIR